MDVLTVIGAAGAVLLVGALVAGALLLRRRRDPAGETSAAVPTQRDHEVQPTAPSASDAEAPPAPGPHGPGRHAGDPLALPRELALAAAGTDVSRARHAGPRRDERADDAEGATSVRFDSLPRPDAA